MSKTSHEKKKKLGKFYPSIPPRDETCVYTDLGTAIPLPDWSPNQRRALQHAITTIMGAREEGKPWMNSRVEVYEYADNLRFARKNNPDEVESYKLAQEHGC